MGRRFCFSPHELERGGGIMKHQRNKCVQSHSECEKCGLTWCVPEEAVNDQPATWGLHLRVETASRRVARGRGAFQAPAAAGSPPAAGSRRSFSPQRVASTRRCTPTCAAGTYLASCGWPVFGSAAVSPQAIVRMVQASLRSALQETAMHPGGGASRTRRTVRQKIAGASA